MSQKVLASGRNSMDADADLTGAGSYGPRLKDGTQPHICMVEGSEKRIGGAIQASGVEVLTVELESADELAFRGIRAMDEVTKGDNEMV
ncbi:hypothetical protein BDZ89DRAFT_1082504 [Hymenopellis radicata]|nr:hypothetical protein BDZ89DRAFT_1082504 [Hymenopellis radicata]